MASISTNLGFESRSERSERSTHSITDISGMDSDSGLSCADYTPEHGTAFDAFLDTVPTSVDRVVWLDDDRSSSARRVHVFDRNGQGGSIDLVLRCGVPRYYAATAHEHATTVGSHLPGTPSRTIPRTLRPDKLHAMSGTANPTTPTMRSTDPSGGRGTSTRQRQQHGVLLASAVGPARARRAWRQVGVTGRRVRDRIHRLRPP